MLLRTATATGEVRRNIEYVPSRGKTLSYPSIELLASDKTLGVTLVSATLRIAPTFGSAPAVTITITTAASAAGQITDDAATDGIGALAFELTPAQTSLIVSPSAFEVFVVDSLGRATPLDAGAFVQDPTAIVAVAATVELTPTPVNVPSGTTEQLTAVIRDSNGSVLTDVGVLWSTSDPAIATVNGSGLVTGVANGPVTITATAVLGNVSAAAAVTVTQAQDGSDADYEARLAEAGITHIGFIHPFDLSKVTEDGAHGVSQILPVVGPASLALKGYQDGGGIDKLPRRDLVTGYVEIGTQAAANTLDMDPTALLDLGTKEIFVLTAGSWQVGGGTAGMGFHHATDTNVKAVIQGAFFPTPQLDAFHVTSAITQYFFHTKVPATAQVRPLIWWLPQPEQEGASGASKLATALYSVVSPGRFRRTQRPIAVNSNFFTKFPSATYGFTFGGFRFGANGVNNARATFAGLSFTDKPPTSEVLEAWERWCAAHNVPIDLTETEGVDDVGDSREQGNGANNQDTETVSARLQQMLGPTIGVDNRGISGDDLENLILEPRMSRRLGYDKDSSRTRDTLFLMEDVNSYQKVPPLPVATGIANLRTAAATARAQGYSRIIVTKAFAPVPNPQHDDHNAGVDAMKADGTIDEFVDPNGDPRYWPTLHRDFTIDNLHENRDGMIGLAAMRASCFAEPTQHPAGQIVWEGDGIMAGDGGIAGAQRFSNLVMARPWAASLTPFYQATSGARIADLVARAGTTDGHLGAGLNILVLNVGMEDIQRAADGANATIDPIVNAYWSYIDARLDAGWTVIFCPLIPSKWRNIGQASQATLNQALDYFNYRVRSDHWNHDGTAHNKPQPLSAEVQVRVGFLDFTASWNSPTYYQVDGVNPNTAGHAQLATYIRDFVRMVVIGSLVP